MGCITKFCFLAIGLCQAGTFALFTSLIFCARVSTRTTVFCVQKFELTAVAPVAVAIAEPRNTCVALVHIQTHQIPTRIIAPCLILRANGYTTFIRAVLAAGTGFSASATMVISGELGFTAIGPTATAVAESWLTSVTVGHIQVFKIDAGAITIYLISWAICLIN